MLVVVCDDDQGAGRSIRAAKRAPRAERLHLASDHYIPFLEVHEEAVALELKFLVWGQKQARGLRTQTGGWVTIIQDAQA